MSVTGKNSSTRSVAILVTRRCNMTCAHCSVESAPRVDSADPSEETLLRLVRETAAAGVPAIQFTGGEPMMRQKVVLRLMQEARTLGVKSGISTNGFWGKNPATARKTLKEMIRNGLEFMTVSYDRYHAEFMGPDPILNIASVAADLGFSFNVNVTRTTEDENQIEYARLFGNLPNVRMRLYDVQPVGRARKFEMPSLRSETEGFCNSVTQPTICEDGRVIACNGPSYFDPVTSPRYIGDTATASVESLLQKHQTDPIIDTIRTFGPAGLRDELKKDSRFAVSFDRRFAGQCDLCHHITGNPEMIQHLKTQLSDPSHTALRAAKWKMINAARTSGKLTRDYANGPGAARIFYTKITANQWDSDTGNLLGRADIDWDNLATYLAGSGLAKQLAPAATQSHIARWAPPYFEKNLQKRAMADALRELSHRETLAKIHDALISLDIPGILLKGAALYLKEQAAGIDALRIPGDIDILVSNPEIATRLRRHLVESGFNGHADDPRTGPHHLAPVCLRGSAVEIHTGIMPAFWGLPEKSMIQNSVNLDGWSNFKTLSAEDMILHEAVHSTSHLYSFGLKLAMDIFRIHRLAEKSDAATLLNWDAIAASARNTRCPMAFWTPLLALRHGLDGLPVNNSSQEKLLPIPDTFWNAAPKSRQLERMTLVAGKRIFSAVDNAEAMNPFTRNGIFLLLHDSNLSRFRYLTELSSGSAAESRRTALSSQGGQSWKQLGGHLKSAWHDVKAYRRATRSNG